MHEHKLRGKIWRYHGQAAWHFLTLPKTTSSKIGKFFHGVTRGWGSLPVKVTMGSTSWKTSIFPDKKLGAYLLPLKLEVRKKEGLAANHTVTYLLEILL